MELETKTVDLEKRFEGINNWIKDNPNTNPNFCEMIGCILDFGKLNAKYVVEYSNRRIGVSVCEEAEKHNIPLLFDEMKVVRNNLEEMISLREDSDFFKDEFAKNYMNQLLESAALGKFQLIEQGLYDLKEKILTQVAAVYFYIWETKQREPNYVYDNKYEFCALEDNYKKYKYSFVDCDNVQFGDIVEEMLDRIENNKIMNVCQENVVENDSKLNELNLQAYSLKERYKGINGWIEQNMNTAPNFREMIDCIIEYGSLLSRFNGYFKENGYPIIEEKDREATHYEIPVVVPEVKAAQEQLHTMMRLRGKHEFFKDETAKNFIQELTYRAETADYDESLDPAVAVAKKDAMCIAAGVYFYIWDTQQRESWYKYDNVSEWNDLNNKYALYKETVGIQEEVRYDDHIYQGPQFGEVLEAMIDGIGKNSVFSEEKTNAEEDNIGSHK